MSTISCKITDDTFGPSAGACRGGFDFTLLFEESILSILPIALLLGIVPLRILYLFKKSVKADGKLLLISKLVCTWKPLLDVEIDMHAKHSPM